MDSSLDPSKLLMLKKRRDLGHQRFIPRNGKEEKSKEALSSSRTRGGNLESLLKNKLFIPSSINETRTSVIMGNFEGQANSHRSRMRKDPIVARSQILDAPHDFSGTSQRLHNINNEVDSSTYFMHPSNPVGNCFDLTDRMILCASTHGEEIAVGSANHSVYSLTADDTSKKVTEMYNKSFGHSDWVTDVCHLADGRVVSSGMDRKICLWSFDKRTATEVYAHGGSIARVAADQRYNLAVSCGYDRTICLWKFPTSVSKFQRIADPLASLKGHSAPVLHFFFHNSLLGSGARDGSVYIWNMQTCKILRKYKGHAAPISVVKTCTVDSNDENIFISAAADGCMKLWDHRVQTAVLVTSPHQNGAINEIVQLNDRYIISGGADSRICVLDLRKELGVVTSYNHCNNSVYSLCSVGDACIFAGDGVGMLYCYDIVGNSGDIGLKYGIGASERGAIRCVLPLKSSNKIAACGEDGKILVIDY